jgi:hypothetical protein
MLCIFVATSIIAYPLIASDSRQFDAVFLGIIAMLAVCWVVFVVRQVVAYVERRDDLSRCQLMTATVQNRNTTHGGGIALLVAGVLLCTSVVLSIAYIIMRNVTRWGLSQKLASLANGTRVYTMGKHKI